MPALDKDRSSNLVIKDDDVYRKQPLVLKETKDDDVAIDGEGVYDRTRTNNEESQTLGHEEGEDEQVKSQLQSPQLLPPPDDDSAADDVDAIGRLELIQTLKLDEGNEGGDDPYTEEEKAMLDEGVRTIKGAIADTQKIKVRKH
jgi:hypothetical protein